MKSEKFTVKVDGEKRQVIAVDLLSDITPSETALDKVHHIMLLDRSHSMHYEINGLIDDVKKSFESIGDEDYLSIIWFSSPGQFKTVIKGAKKTDDIKKLLDSMRSTIGTTCFSDPLKEAESIIDDLAAICGNILVTLFTDGNPVVPWTITEEKKRVFESIGRLNGKVIGVNTIGYGHYYDRNFLQEVADETEFGMFRHSNQITQFHPLFMKNYESVTEMTGMAIDVKCEGAEFMYLGSKIAKLSKELSLSSSDSKRSTLFIVSKTAPNFELNGDVVKAKG
ncbi:MAG: VWA domain-containing protein, partial [Candidatus Peribacteraceae bacterium]|nr:VWA domain-containing protein [Candidatus Peribacteraceae bacterium]